MIAVMGAAGNVGSKVTERLLAEGEEVRLLEHARRLNGFAERGAEVMPGRLGSPDDLRVLLKGADAALVLLPDDVRDERYVENRRTMAAAIAEALREHPCHVVMLSSVGADHAAGVGQIAGLHDLERRLFELAEVPVLALRSAWRMENLLAALPLVEAQKMNGGAIRGDLPFAMIASRDVARVAAERLIRRDFSGHQVRNLLGPRDVTMREATRKLGERLGLPDLPYLEFPPDGVLEALLRAGMSAEFASLLVESQVAMNEGLLDPGPRTPESTTETALETFLAEVLPR